MAVQLAVRMFRKEADNDESKLSYTYVEMYACIGDGERVHRERY